MINLFGRDRDRPTADTADDRLSLVLSYQRTEIDERKLKQFRARLIELCDEFGYDVVGQVEIRPQTGRDRTTVICASIPVRRRDTVRESLERFGTEKYRWLTVTPLIKRTVFFNAPGHGFDARALFRHTRLSLSVKCFSKKSTTIMGKSLFSVKVNKAMETRVQP